MWRRAGLLFVLLRQVLGCAEDSRVAAAIRFTCPQCRGGWNSAGAGPRRAFRSRRAKPADTKERKIREELEDWTPPASSLASLTQPERRYRVLHARSADPPQAMKEPTYHSSVRGIKHNASTGHRETSEGANHWGGSGSGDFGTRAARGIPPAPRAPSLAYSTAAAVIASCSCIQRITVGSTGDSSTKIQP